MCHGPLFLVKHKNKKIVYCTESIKNLIKLGHDVDIIEKRSRSSILKEKKKKKTSFDYLF